MNKYAYVKDKIGSKTYSLAYRTKLSAVRAPVISALNRAKDNNSIKPLAVAVETCLLTGLIPTSTFYNDFNLAPEQFKAALIVKLNDENVSGLISDLILSGNDEVVSDIVPRLYGTEFRFGIRKCIIPLLSNDNQFF